jgi:hypothetical protein
MSRLLMVLCLVVPIECGVGVADEPKHHLVPPSPRIVRAFLLPLHQQFVAMDDSGVFSLYGILPAKRNCELPAASLAPRLTLFSQFGISDDGALIAAGDGEGRVSLISSRTGTLNGVIRLPWFEVVTPELGQALRAKKVDNAVEVMEYMRGFRIETVSFWGADELALSYGDGTVVRVPVKEPEKFIVVKSGGFRGSALPVIPPVDTDVYKLAEEYFGTRALDAESWKFPESVICGAQNRRVMNLILATKKEWNAIVCREPESVCCYDAQTGGTKWRFQSTSFVAVSPNEVSIALMETSQRKIVVRDVETGGERVAFILDGEQRLGELCGIAVTDTGRMILLRLTRDRFVLMGDDGTIEHFTLASDSSPLIDVAFTVSGDAFTIINGRSVVSCQLIPLGR